MEKTLFSVRRFMRRTGSILMVAAVLTAIAFGWLLDRCSEMVHALILALGLKRFENWLKGLNVWFPFTVMGLMFLGSLAFKVYEVHLIRNNHYLRAISLALLLKVVYPVIFNYLVHLYKERFLEIAFIAKWYGRYERIRDDVLSRMRKQRWYRIAVVLKRRIIRRFKRRIASVKAWFARYARRRTLLAIARRVVRRWRHV